MTVWPRGGETAAAAAAAAAGQRCFQSNTTHVLGSCKATPFSLEKREVELVESFRDSSPFLMPRSPTGTDFFFEAAQREKRHCGAAEYIRTEAES